MRYWRLPEDAKFLKVLECICADEAHHRDINHTFAELGPKNTNPFVTSYLFYE